jgi:hypothetical protein
VKRRPYPLDALRTLRDANVRTRTEELGRRIQSRERAEQAHATAETRRQEREEAVRSEQRAERERLEGGELRAADLEAQARWAQGQEQTLSSLRERERHAAEELRSEGQNEALAQQALAHAEYSAKVTEQHQSAWQRAERVRAEDAEEDESLDVHAARAQILRSRGEP